MAEPSQWNQVKLFIKLESSHVQRTLKEPFFMSLKCYAFGINVNYITVISTGVCLPALCSSRCLNGGMCMSPGVCICPPGYYGASCEKGMGEYHLKFYTCRLLSASFIFMFPVQHTLSDKMIINYTFRCH